jgi:hypothetical protein
MYTGKYKVGYDLIIAALNSNPTLGRKDLIKLAFKDYKYSEKEVDSLRKYFDRYLSTIKDEHEGIYRTSAAVDVSPNDAKHMWIKKKLEDGTSVSTFIKNPNFVDHSSVNLDKLQEDVIKAMQDYSPNFKKIKREKSDEEYLLVIDPADIHVGKLSSAFETGEEYNQQIAVQRAIDGVKGILQKASSYKFDKILFIGGNDVLHIDNPRRMTTSGTPQDTDGMWHDNFMHARQMYVDMLEILISYADVHFTFNPSNHDYMSGFFLVQVIQAHFRNCPNITFDVDLRHRKAFEYHSNLIGSTHGDGAKSQDLPLLLATEFPLEWSRCKHKYIYTHHLHHKVSKDYLGVCVETLRSPSSADSWHMRNGYQHAPKAIEGFIHSKLHGQICRITHIFSIIFIINLF